ncbi:cell division protein FtsA [Candidatus Riesia pediculicola]|uniref:Cell division protein FtsA n=1 Tax=Riesia pediculicola (strain USDA) TaxID=515618 RepID=D4G8Q6_RIEPU|nr:cell division protein FtsA [Candidatus Riesia pediculicola]ADD79846.1 cell division protein FtsA [Candidatus Riesia pediculicola USDA]ARC53929.1 cell division protein FtsA [Candidatus Riesia pediculicola]QOJ86556.1 cell division protein FtsA [Candidatus Riesia pediculicola]
MAKIADKKLIVGLEIGTYKVSSLVGEILQDGTINVIGIGNVQSQGMNKGYVNNLESVVQCIRQVIEQAEMMADCQVSSVYLAISGKHINCQNEIGIVPILSKEEVTQEDVDNVVHTAKSVRIRDKYEILHVIPQEYAIDHQVGIRNPIGLSGVRIQAKVHIITCHVDMTKNLIKAVERCGIKVDQVIFSGLASSYSVLTEEERELGVCMIDIGGGTMDIAIYSGGSLRHTKVIPYAGNIVTSDIAYVFGTLMNDAEIIKIKYGCACSNLIDKEEQIEIPDISGRSSTKVLKRYSLSKVIEPRYMELLGFVNSEILRLQKQLRFQSDKRDMIKFGIVLTGGGSKIEGIIECAKTVFKTNQVRIGKPLNVAGSIKYAEESNYSTVIGLLHYGKYVYLQDESRCTKKTLLNTWLHKVINWIKREF